MGDADISREEYSGNNVTGTKHNARYDATVTLVCYRILMHTLTINNKLIEAYRDIQKLVL